MGAKNTRGRGCRQIFRAKGLQSGGKCGIIGLRRCDGTGRRARLKRRQLPLSSTRIHDRKSLEEPSCFGNPERLSFFEGASVADRLTRESIRTHFPTKKHLCRCGGIGRRPGFKIQCPQGRAGSTPATGTIREWARCKTTSHKRKSQLAPKGVGWLSPLR